jgi:hypothetical protein
MIDPGNLLLHLIKISGTGNACWTVEMREQVFFVADGVALGSILPYLAIIGIPCCMIPLEWEGQSFAAAASQLPWLLLNLFAT